MPYETKTFRLRTSAWIRLSVDNTDDFEIQSRGGAQFMLFVGVEEPLPTLRSELVYARASFNGLDNASIWGKALGQDTIVTVMRRVNSINIEPITLQPLQLSSTSLRTTSVEGGEIAAFTNKTPGSIVSLKRGTGAIALNGDGTKVLKGDKPIDIGSFKETFVESHSMAVNNGFETEIVFFVSLGGAGGLPAIPAGFQFLTGADGAILTGADGALLYGVSI